MDRLLSIGLVELAIIAGVAGMVLLAGAIVVAVVVKTGRDRRAQATGSDGASAPARSAGHTWIWILLAILLVSASVPLCAVVGGLMIFLPVQRGVVTESGIEPEVYVIEQGESITTLPSAVAEPLGTPSSAAQSSGATQPASTQAGRSTLLSLNPFNPTAFVMLIGFAGLVLLLGVAVVAVVGKGWRGADEPAGAIQENGDLQETGSWTRKLRTVLLAVVLWIALSVFLILDLLFQVSLYWQFVVIYAAFWLLVGALLVSGRPLRDKLLILGLFVLVLASVRFVDWNSRKPFLRDFRGLQEGMTAEEVDQIMSGYMKAYGGGPPQTQDEYQFDEQGGIVTGWVTYRHTNEGWGNSDWGVVTFENGQVVQLRFLPD